MNSRDKILQSIRRHTIAPIPRPSLDENWIQYDDCHSQFSATLESVGGQVRYISSRQALRGALEQLEPFSAARRRCLLVDGAGEGNVDLQTIDDPHALEDVDFALLPAQIAVAENAALWVTAEQIKHRAICFIAQHLGLVIDADQFVHNMHEAYERIGFAESEFGCFISGPSKTADIEQSLVIGAHGPRSLTVFVVEDPRPE